MIKFTRHAQQKFRILKVHDFQISKKKVIEVINNPEEIDYSRSPLLIAQDKIDTEHVLRVVYKEQNGDKIVITFYPGRIKQYAKKDKTKN